VLIGRFNHAKKRQKKFDFLQNAAETEMRTWSKSVSPKKHHHMEDQSADFGATLIAFHQASVVNAIARTGTCGVQTHPPFRRTIE